MGALRIAYLCQGLTKDGVLTSYILNERAIFLCAFSAISKTIHLMHIHLSSV